MTTVVEDADLLYAKNRNVRVNWNSKQIPGIIQSRFGSRLKIHLIDLGVTEIVDSENVETLIEGTRESTTLPRTDIPKVENGVQNGIPDCNGSKKSPFEGGDMKSPEVSSKSANGHMCREEPQRLPKEPPPSHSAVVNDSPEKSVSTLPREDQHHFMNANFSTFNTSNLQTSPGSQLTFLNRSIFEPTDDIHKNEYSFYDPVFQIGLPCLHLKFKVAFVDSNKIVGIHQVTQEEVQSAIAEMKDELKPLSEERLEPNQMVLVSCPDNGTVRGIYTKSQRVDDQLIHHISLHDHHGSVETSTVWECPDHILGAAPRACFGVLPIKTKDDPIKFKEGDELTMLCVKIEENVAFGFLSKPLHCD